MFKKFLSGVATFALALSALVFIQAQPSHAAYNAADWNAGTCAPRELKLNVETTTANEVFKFPAWFNSPTTNPITYTFSWTSSPAGATVPVSTTGSVSGSGVVGTNYSATIPTIGKYTMSLVVSSAGTNGASYLNSFGDTATTGKANWKALVCWGDQLGLRSLQNAFTGAVNLESVPTTLPIYTGSDTTNPAYGAKITSLQSTFESATNFNSPDILTWDTQYVTSMTNTFAYTKVFNQPISWDTRALSISAGTFMSALAFNQPLTTSGNTWNMSKNTSTYRMFQGAPVFNQPLSSWDTSKNTNMSYMFNGASVFNQDLSSWKLPVMTNAMAMFQNAVAFTNAGQPLKSNNSGVVTAPGVDSFNATNWNTKAITNMAGMFWGATSFNQDISNWNTSAVTGTATISSGMYGMFGANPNFNQNLNTSTGAATATQNSWYVANVNNFNSMFSGDTNFNNGGVTLNWTINTAAGGSVNMNAMFNNAKAFNSSLASFDTQNVVDMSYMFFGASKFNQSLAHFNTAKVTNMSYMFSGASAFNQPLTTSGNIWKTTLVTNFNSMFSSATAFNQDISLFDFAAAKPTATVAPMFNFLNNSGMSSANYGTLLKSIWGRTASATPTAGQIFNSGITLGATALKVGCPAATDTTGAQYARAMLQTKGWSTSGDIVETCVTAPATIKVMASSGSNVYGNSAQLILYSTDMQDSDNFKAPITCSAKVSSGGAAVTAATDVGTGYVAECSSTATTTAQGSTIQFVNASYSVSRAPLTITANSISKQYGQTGSLYAATGFVARGLKNSDAISSVSLTSAGTASTATIAGGPYAISISSAAFSTGTASNYDITYTDGLISITKAKLKITANDKTKAQGTLATFFGGLSSSGLLTRFYHFTTNLDATASKASEIIPESTRVRNAFDVTYADKRYDATCEPITGAVDFQNFTDGPLGPDTIAGHCGSNTNAQAAGNTAVYERDYVIYSTGYLTPKVSGNYKLCTSSDDGSFVKLAGVPGATTEVVIRDWGLHGASATCDAESATLALTAGVSYPIDYWGFQGAVDNVFRLKWKVPGSSTFVVIPIEYFANSVTDYTVEGLVNGDTVTAVDISSSGAPTSAAIGSYDIIPELGSSNASLLNNYDVEYVYGTLTVGAAPANAATIIARSQVRTYGQSNVSVTNAYDVSGSPASAVTCKVYSDNSYSHELLASEYKVGTYVIHCTGNNADNFRDGTYSVQPKPVTLKFGNLTKNYGQTLTASDATLTYADGSFETGDALYGFTGSSFDKTLGTAKRGVANSTAPNSDALKLETVDPHGFTAGDTVQLIAFGNGNPISSGIYRVDEIVDSKTFTILGDFVTSDLTWGSYSGGLGIQVAKETGFEAAAPVGTYVVSGSPSFPCNASLFGKGLENYDFTCVSGTLTVNPLALTVTAANKEVNSGATLTDPLTYTVATFANGESEQTASGYVAPTCSTNYSPAAPSSAAPFAVQCSSGNATNYVFNYSNGTVTIKSASTGGGGSTPPAGAAPTVQTQPSTNLNGSTINVNLGTYSTAPNGYQVTVSVNNQNVQVIQLNASQTSVQIQVSPTWAGKTVRISITASVLGGASTTTIKSILIPKYFKNIVLVSGKVTSGSTYKFVVLNFTSNSAILSSSQKSSLRAAGIANSDAVSITGHTFPWSTVAYQHSVSLARALAVRNQLKISTKAKIVSVAGVGSVTNQLCKKVYNRCVVVAIAQSK